MARPAMLEGLRIADMSTVVFGPYATQVMADLGAEVIKLEPPDGDTIRLVGNAAATPGMSPLHLRLNRGKRSVDWDLKTPAGREAMNRLLATSDVFIHNVRGDAIARAGLDYDSVRAIRPDIVYVHCTGFDQRGPYAGLQAYDDIIQAASGIASLAPRVDGNPQPRYLPTLLADKVSGLHAAYAVLAALVHRLRSGEGQCVEVPMFESLASFTLLEHLYEASFRPPVGASCMTRAVDPARRPLPTADGWVALAPFLDERWVRLFEAAGHGDVLREPMFADKASRRRHISALNHRLAGFTPERTTDEWLALAASIQVPAMRVNDIDDLIEDPQLAASGLLREREHPSEGRYLEVGQPVRFSAWAAPEAAHAPQVGEHSAEVARELGLDWPPPPAG